MDLESTLFDPEKEEQGVWQPFGEDGELLVARMFSDKWNAVYRRLARPHGRRLQRDPDVQRRVMEEAMAECVLLGWKNLRVGGKEIKYTKDAARDLLQRFPALKTAVLDIAQDDAVFRAETEEEHLGN